MKDFKTLQLLDKFQFIFHKIGVDYAAMRQILYIKLLLDERKAPTFFNEAATKNNEEKKYGYIKTLWIYTLMGLILIPFMAFGDNYLFQMSITYAMFIFIIMTTLISEFSSVLLDIRDRSILYTKPISEKTVNVAKFMHILIYLTYLTIAFTAIPLVVALIKQGVLFFLITVLEIVLINIFVVVLTALLYLVILRFFDGEKLKDIINYVQIGLSLVLMIGYQFVVRSFEFVNLDVVVEMHWWSVLLIPMWFASVYEVVLHANYSLLPIVFTMLSVIIPIVSMWLYIKLIPVFERNLQKLLSTSKSKQEHTYRLKQILLKVICTSNDERAFFRFSSLMMKQERDFKLKVYPSLGFALVVPFIFIVNNVMSDDVDFTTSMSYLTIYASLLMVPTAVIMLGHSAKYKAAWIYKSFPVHDYTDFKKGSLKAFLVKLFTPLYLLLSIAFCIIYGVRIIPDLLVVLFVSFLYTVVCYVSYGSNMPFSKPFNEIGDAQGWRSLILMIPVAAMAGIHYLMTSNLTYGTLIYLGILIIVNLCVWKIVFRRGKKYNDNEGFFGA